MEKLRELSKRLSDQTQRSVRRIGTICVVIGIIVAVIGLYLYVASGDLPKATREMVGGPIQSNGWGLPLLVFSIILLLIGALVTNATNVSEPDKEQLDATITNAPVTPEPKPSTSGDVYTAYFGLWATTRQERHDYNTYFLTLLFVNTLVAIFTALLGTTQGSAYWPLIRTLFLGILIAAVIISIVWACKLFVLNIVEGSQQTVLKAMEKSLQLPDAEMDFTTQVLPFWESAKKTASGRIGIELFQNRQEKEVRGRWWYQFFWWASYWALPFLFIALYVVLAYLFYTNPSFIPLPTPTPTPALSLPAM